MESSASVSPKSNFVEALGLGSAIGVVHAMAEVTLLAWNDIALAALDVGIIAGVSAAAGGALAVVAAIALQVRPLRTGFGIARGPRAARGALWAFVVAAYVLVYSKIIYYQSGWNGALTWFLPAVPSLALAGFAVGRKAHGALVPVCAAALVATTLCALQLVHAEWGHEPVNQGSFAIRLLTPVGVCLLALIAVGRRTPIDAPFESFQRAAVPLTLGVAGWAGLVGLLTSGLSLGRFFNGEPLQTNQARPNILLIVMDTVRADHLDLFGYHRETMPNLRRFALEECQVANRMFTPGSWTLPSHASMFTGLYPSAHGAHYPFVNQENPGFLASPMREDVPTLAGFLGSLGYRTAGIVANFGVLSSFGISRGFEDYSAAPGPAYFAPRMLWLYRFRVGDWSAGAFVGRSLPGGLQGRSTMFSLRQPETSRARDINAHARRWLEGHGDHPFFLFLNYMDAHDPYLPIPEDDERFMKRPPGNEWFGFPRERLAESKRGAAKFSPEEIEFLKAQYDAELVSLDRELGRLLDYLRNSGLYENTLILVTTDHVEAFFEHGFPDHGNSLYQPEVGGFLLIKAPSSMGPIEVSPLMQAVDFLPSIAVLVNEPLPSEVQGLPWGVGRDYALSEVFCKSCGRELFGARWPDALRHDLVAVMNGEQKLIRSTQGQDEVYSLVDDPSESKPLSKLDPEFLRHAEKAIAARNERLVESLSARPEDKILLEKLRSLGYIQ